ncbi:hypothetical protein SI65_07241 [Aspergillus cristatus]|uniref:Uncharacterized protein n=1 Tax=Aspergillus cristatus TaxID=573508 RepID=A0A1E3BAY5_ASPCR|nr:hypothetical protein SI65_07241 [Aspergillus cristatus]
MAWIFTKSSERTPKLVPLPPLFNDTPEIAISILHTHHRTLAEAIYPRTTIESTDAKSNSTVFVIHAPGYPQRITVTFRNFMDGLSILEEGSFGPGMRMAMRWKLADGGAEFLPGTRCLEESGHLSCYRLLTPIPESFTHEYHFKTVILWTLLHQMSVGERVEARSAGVVLTWGKSGDRKEKSE